MSSQGQSFGFPCAGSFLSHLQLRKCTVEIRDMVGSLPPITTAFPEPLPPSQGSIRPFTHLWSQGQTSCQAAVIGVLWEEGVPYLGGNSRMLHRAGCPSPNQGASAHQGLEVMLVSRVPGG